MKKRILKKGFFMEQHFKGLGEIGKLGEGGQGVILDPGKNGVAHGGGADFFGAFAPDVAGAKTVIDGLADGGFDGDGGIFLSERMAQEHGGAEDLRDGIGDALAGNVGRGAAAGFIQSKGQAGGRVDGAEAGAGKHAEGACDHGHFIAQDVAKKVFGEDDIEAFGLADELHGGVIDVKMVEDDIGVVSGDLGDCFAPEDAVFEDVGFIDGGEFFTASPGGLEGDVGDAFDLAFFINHRVDGDGFAVTNFGAFGLTEIKAAGEFAHAKHIETARNDVGPDRRSVGEGRETKRGAKVGKQSEVFAKRKECGAFGLLMGGEIFPFGASDAAKKNGVAFFAGGQGIGRECGAVVVDGNAADTMLGKLQIKGETRGDDVEDATSLGHDFGPDAVARENSDVVGGGHKKRPGMNSEACFNRFLRDFCRS